MAAEVRLSDGTVIKTDANENSDDVLRRITGTGRPDNAAVRFVALRDEGGETYRVNPGQIVYIRDI